MKRYDILNYLITKYNLKSYLEIGVASFETFNRIQCELKHCVDPNKETNITPTYNMTSDDFFKNNVVNTYDIVFIDGLHLEEQVDKDIQNALNILNDGGFIVIHDSNPRDENMGTEKWLVAEWNGTVWKSVVKQNLTNNCVDVCTVDTDYGCAILTKRKNELKILKDITVHLNWNNFSNNRKEMLNLITVDEFKNNF